MTSPVEYTQPWLMLVEGVLDTIFFDHFLRARNIHGIQVHEPKHVLAGGDKGGRDCFGECISAALTQTAVKGILLVSDNDTNPSASFSKVKEQIRSAGLTEPQSPLVVIDQANALRVAVLMLPWTDVPGCLETLCLDATYSKWPDLRNPLERYIEATPAGKWEISPRSKMLFRCLTATGCKRDPNAGMRVLDRNGCEFSMSHASFDRLGDFLATLPGVQIQSTPAASVPSLATSRENRSPL